jgi:hypothetical protein
VITGTLLVWLIKFGIRPLNLFNEPVRFLLGIAPNLLGSFLIPFAAYWFFTGRDHLLARLFKIRTAFDLHLVCLLAFGLLVLNEYLQQIPVFGRTFDPFDILFSAFGLTLAARCFPYLFRRFRSGFREYR